MSFTLVQEHHEEASIADILRSCTNAFNLSLRAACADATGILLDSQKAMTARAKAMVNAPAKVGIAALIDEATGYQTERSPDALRLLVQASIEKEQREWEKDFPNDFYLILNKAYESNPYIAR